MPGSKKWHEFNRGKKLSNHMKKLFVIFWYLGSFLAVSLSHAADFKQSKFTQVVNDVWVVSAADSSQKFAAVNDLFTMPDLVRTGAASRAELVAADDTITRVGANTIFPLILPTGPSTSSRAACCFIRRKGRVVAPSTRVRPRRPCLAQPSSSRPRTMAGSR
jgi:hypothetical protein